jgi:hypothetical protein
LPKHNYNDQVNQDEIVWVSSINGIEEGCIYGFNGKLRKRPVGIPEWILQKLG